MTIMYADRHVTVNMDRWMYADMYVLMNARTDGCRKKCRCLYLYVHAYRYIDTCMYTYKHAHIPNVILGNMSFKQGICR